MEPIVLDSNVFISYLVESEEFHQRARNYIDSLEGGKYTFHLPMLVMVEVASVIIRRDPLPNRLALLARWQRTIWDWEQAGKLILYPLDRERMDNAVNSSQQYRLRGADSIIAALSEELDIPLKTFDKEMLAQFQRASV